MMRSIAFLVLTLILSSCGKKDSLGPNLSPVEPSIVGPLPKEDRKAVLVIDTQMDLLANGYLRDRVLAYYQFDPRIEEFKLKPSLKENIPKTYLELIENLYHQSSNPFSKDSQKKKYDFFYNQNFDLTSKHGDSVLSVLGISNPNVDFVLFESDSNLFFPYDRGCEISRPEVIDRFFDDYTQKVIDIVQKYNVIAINGSFGLFNTDIQKELAPFNCDPKVTEKEISFYLQRINKVWDDVYEKTGAVFFNAGMGVIPSVLNIDEYAWDCYPRKGVVRVYPLMKSQWKRAFENYKDVENQVINTSQVNDFPEQISSCIDIFVLSKFVNEYPNPLVGEVPRGYYSDDMISFSLVGGATSYITPYVVSQYIYQLEKGLISGPEEYLGKIKDARKDNKVWLSNAIFGDQLNFIPEDPIYLNKRIY